MKIIILVTFLTFNFALLTFPIPTYAAVCPSPPSASPGPFDIGCQFGFGGLTSLGQATTKLINPIFSIAATLVTLYFIFGVYDFTRSGGDKEEVARARKMMTHAIVGFILLIFAFLILEFIPQFFNFTGQDIIKLK